MRARVESLTPDTEVVVDGEAEVGMAFGERRVPAHIALQILEAGKVILASSSSRSRDNPPRAPAQSARGQAEP